MHILVWFLMAVLYINMEKYKPINTPAKIENEKDLLTITIPEIQWYKYEMEANTEMLRKCK